MKKVKNMFMPFMMLLIMAVSFTSCEEDEPYYSPLVGSWELLEDVYGVVPQTDIDRLHFNANGVGVYEAIDPYTGYWGQWIISWKEYAGNYNDIVEIYFEDGTRWEYYWEVDNRGYLYLYDRWNPEIYLVYRSLY